MNNLDPIINRLAKTIFVVLYKTKPTPRHPTGQLTLLTEPGEGTVWSIHNKAVAEHHAKLNNGMAATWEDAYRLLMKEYGTPQQLEDELMQRAVAAQEESQKRSEKATDVPGVRGGTDFNDNVNTNN